MFLDTVRNYWYPIAPASNVTSKPAQFKLLGETLVAYRDDTGPVVFKDACAHRGAALSKGWLTNGALTCPYHGWQYDRSGQCMFIPSLIPGEKIPATAKAAAYQVREAYGLIWVCHSAQQPRFPEWPDAAWGRADFRVFCTGQYVWNANAARVLENGLDFSHFNFAHKGLTELADGPIIKPHVVNSHDELLKLTYDDGHVSREFTVDFPFILHNRKRVIRVENGATWSSNANSKLNDITTVSLLAAPLSEMQTMFFGFLARNHSLDMSDEEFASGFDGVLEQDRGIVESQMPKIIPDDLESEIHVRYADIGCVAYRRMFKAAKAKVAA
jgi:phenylpropionate dioxygenase-like ring-hydroxylating dioxygenase large terminal subunit